MRHQLILWLITPAIVAPGSGWAIAQSNYANAVLSDNPVAYYRLNEETVGTVFDASSVSGSQNAMHVNFGTGIGSGNIAQPGPRPTDMVGGIPLLGFEATNFAPHFAGGFRPLAVAI